ncbi:MAG: 2-succinyl-5-enolpyruvyl-6-hydroxy-3-cyclohexene-1-carboxylic-acid synthase, partial [Brachybacterium tyrofermentans]
MPAPAPTGSGAVDQAIAIWRALAELGVTDAVLAPGSRSAPLVYGLAGPQLEGTVRAHVRIDERAAAFTALGLSRFDPEHPAVVATTSGTATAHLHAAVMEAHHSRIPLIVLTADRPAELRDVGANQTTRQAGMFRSLVRLDADLPAPTADAATDSELRTAVSTMARAHAAATGEHPGPVHLNLSFRDPLVPRSETASQAVQAVPAVQEGSSAERPQIVLTRRSRPLPPQPRPVPISARTVVVAGDGAGAAARELAERHALPLLAEPSSGAHAGPSLIPGYPALLAEVMADPQHPLRPDRAIVLGHPTLSRPVIGRLLGAPDVDVVVVDPQLDFADAARRARLVVPAAHGDDNADEAELERRRQQLVAWQRAASRVTA